MEIVQKSKDEMADVRYSRAWWTRIYIRSRTQGPVRAVSKEKRVITKCFHIRGSRGHACRSAVSAAQPLSSSSGRARGGMARAGVAGAGSVGAAEDDGSDDERGGSVGRMRSGLGRGHARNVIGRRCLGEAREGAPRGTVTEIYTGDGRA